MTMHDAEFWKLYKKLQLKKRGWLKVRYTDQISPTNEGTRHEVIFKLPTKNALRTMMTTHRKSYSATEVQIWDMTEGPNGTCLLTIDTKNGKVLI